MDSNTNILREYKEASALMKKSSRGKNPDWYREATVLDFQLHLLPVGDQFRAFLLDAKARSWKTELEAFEREISEEELANRISQIRKDHLPKECRSLGVVLHLNIEASVFEFPFPESEGEVNLSELRSAIVTDPAFVLQDRTMEDQSLAFRIHPTPGSSHADKIGCAVATSHFGKNFLRRFRDLANKIDFPIRTAALSSPLLLLSRLPRTFGEQEKSFCVMLRFDSFSFFGFYHASGELILFRSLKHANRELPPNLESILRTTAAAVELHEIELRVFDCRRDQSSPLEQHLQQLIFNFQFQVDPAPETNRQMPIELNAYLIDDEDESLAYKSTETFGKVLKEKWHLQDFLPESEEETAAMPGPIDMKLLRAGRIAFRGGIAALIAFGAFVGWSSISKMTSQAWKYPQAEVKQSLQLSKELGNVKLLENLLADRSKGWTNLEMLSRIFPLNGDVRFTDVNHGVIAEKPTAAVLPKAAIVKTWKIQGLAKNGAYEQLAELHSPEGIGKIFKDVYDATGSKVFDLTAPSRNLMVNLDWNENPGYNPTSPKSEEQMFPYQFTLEIKQRIEANDELALPIAKIQQ